MKNKVKVIAALAICGVLAVGGTIAYMSNSTETKHNVFTIGAGINGEVQEPSWPGNDGKEVVYTPGTTIPKDPQVFNSSEKDGAYVGIKLNYVIDEAKAFETYKANNPETKLTSINDVYALVKASDAESYVKAITTLDFSNDWAVITGTTNGYVYNSEVAAGAKSTPLFTNVKINSDISIKEMLPFEIQVTGYLVQGSDVSLSTATTELAGLMNK